MIFDSDVLIWALRGSRPAGQFIVDVGVRHHSVVTYLELLDGARDRAELRQIKNFLKVNGFRMLTLTENIGNRAAAYMEEYALRVSLGPPDALIAATAVENALPLATGNSRHFRAIQELEIVPFRPR